MNRDLVCSTWISPADPQPSPLSPPALLFLSSTENSGHDNDTEAVSEPTSGCSSLSLYSSDICPYVIMSHHTNCIFMPFWLEWFSYILADFFLLFWAWCSMDKTSVNFFNAAWFFFVSSSSIHALFSMQQLDSCFSPQLHTQAKQK